MFAGHFGVAAAVKAKSTKVPLWSIMVSTQLIDIIFVPLLLMNVETIENVSGKYGGSIIYAFYSHSLIGTLLMAIILGVGAGYLWGKKAGKIIGSVIFSHWILDFLVHRRDLPILPGNLGELPLLGLGLWNYPVISFLLEAMLIIIGAVMYFRSITKEKKGNRALNTATGSLMAVLLLLSLLTDLIGI